MIDSRDLRKGNLICLAHERNAPIVTIREIMDEGATFVETWLFGRTYDLLFPIPLTPDWLRKFGLKERYTKGEWSWAETGNPPFGYSSYTEIYQKEEGFKFLSDYPYLKHVHELQNLYYYLTKKELQVTNMFTTPSNG